MAHVFNPYLRTKMFEERTKSKRSIQILKNWWVWLIQVGIDMILITSFWQVQSLQILSRSTIIEIQRLLTLQLLNKKSIIKKGRYLTKALKQDFRLKLKLLKLPNDKNCYMTWQKEKFQICQLLEIWKDVQVKWYQNCSISMRSNFRM